MNQPKNLKRAIILIVDDSAADREIIKRALGRGRIRCDVYEAENGEKALQYLKKEAPYDKDSDSPVPDLILLDINMPRVSGLEVLKHIRSDEALHRLPVIVLSTSKRDEDVIQSYNLGVNAFVSKPLAADEFIKAIQMLETFWLELVTLPPAEQGAT